MSHAVCPLYPDNRPGHWRVWVRLCRKRCTMCSSSVSTTLLLFSIRSEEICLWQGYSRCTTAGLCGLYIFERVRSSFVCGLCYLGLVRSSAVRFCIRPNYLSAPNRNIRGESLRFCHFMQPALPSMLGWCVPFSRSKTGPFPSLSHDRSEDGQHSSAYRA